MDALLKYCRLCDDYKVKSEFHRNGQYLQSYCKVCHKYHQRQSQRQRQKKPRGFTKLSDEAQDGLLREFGTMSRSSLCRKYNITLSMLNGWVSRGTFHK